MKRAEKRALSWPLVGVVLAVLTVAAVTGLSSLRFDDDYITIFRTDDSGYREYLDHLARFPAEQHNLLAVLRGPVLAGDGVRALLALEDHLRQHPAVSDLYTPLSPPRLRTLAERHLDGDDVLAELAARARTHPVVSRGMLADDGATALLVITLADDGTPPGMQVQALRGELQAVLAPAGIETFLGGIPAIRAALKSQAQQDQALFNALATVLATLVAWWLFRSAPALLAVTLGPVLGVAWTLGAMGLCGVAVNVLTQMVGTLVLVVGYTDAVHVAAHLRQCLADGATVDEAVRRTWREIGPACLVASLTTAAGFASLLLSDAWMIREFGLVCAVGSLAAFVAVMLSTPVAARLLARTPPRPLPAWPLATSGVLRRHPRAVALGGFVLTAVLVASAWQVTPDYVFRENLPRDHEVRLAFETADTHLGGLLPLTVVLQADASTPLATLVDASADLARRLREDTGLHWLGIGDVAALVPGGLAANALAQLPGPLVDSLLDPDTRTTLVSTVLPDHGARATRAVIEQVRATLAGRDGNGMTTRVTGISALAADGSHRMIGDLGRSLATATVLVFAVIALLLRSWRLGLVSLLPNLAPIAMVAATLAWLDEPLRYACVLVFTICLGLAVDDTVHVIMRYRRERVAGLGIDAALAATMAGTGRVLVATSLILVAGFAALTVSATPTVVWMGALSALAIVTALVLDLTLLPALLALFDGDDRRAARR